MCGVVFEWSIICAAVGEVSLVKASNQSAPMGEVARLGASSTSALLEPGAESTSRRTMECATWGWRLAWAHSEHARGGRGGGGEVLLPAKGLVQRSEAGAAGRRVRVSALCVGGSSKAPAKRPLERGVDGEPRRTGGDAIGIEDGGAA